MIIPRQNKYSGVPLYGKKQISEIKNRIKNWYIDEL